MSNQGSIATQGHVHVAQSLPSFAQTFSTASYEPIASGGPGVALPPIQVRSPSHESTSRVTPPRSQRSSPDDPHTSPHTGRKRPHTDDSSPAAPRDEHPRSRHSSPPHPVLVKEEEHDDPASTSHPPLDSSYGTPSLALQPSAPKKRRVTISSGSMPTLQTDLRAPASTVGESTSTPLSPVVIGFTYQHDDPAALETVRSMNTIKQKQKALIDQRRGSAAGISSSGLPPSEELRASGSGTGPGRAARRSPNMGGSSTAAAVAWKHGHPPPSPNPSLNPNPNPTPTTISIPSQPPITKGPGQPGNSLPPPPISFARRRAHQFGSGKKKPADIMISPREEQTYEQRAPSIQSAPPIPHAGAQAGRFPMALPRLPSVLSGGETVRRTVGGNVPPTPTRLAGMQRQQQKEQPAHVQGISSILSNARSPPNAVASVPIASSLSHGHPHAPVPPTPAFHHTGYTAEKSAFLAPFEVFYDALNDAKQLKGWLGEQVHRAQGLVQTLQGVQQQQEKIGEVVDREVERRMGPLRAEMVGLLRRVEELEDALRVAHGQSQSSQHSQAGHHPRRSLDSGPPPSAKGYTFPPPPSISASASASDRDRFREREHEHHPHPHPHPHAHSHSHTHTHTRASPGWHDSNSSAMDMAGERESPAPYSYSTRRLSTSASRLDPPLRPSEASSSGHPAGGGSPETYHRATDEHRGSSSSRAHRERGGNSGVQRHPSSRSRERERSSSRGEREESDRRAAASERERARSHPGERAVK